MIFGTICFLIVITMIVNEIFTGAIKVVALIALGCGALFMFVNVIKLENAALEIKKLKETNDEETK